MAFSLSKYLPFLKGVTAGSASKTDVLGIDIGSSAIKIVQLEKNEDTISLVTYGELQLGPYAETDMGRVTKLPEQTVTEALVDVIREATATSTNGILAIPYAASFMTVVSITAPDESQIATRIPVEARKYIPVQLKDVSLDWFPISTSVMDNEVQQDVLLAAIHNDAIGKYRGVLQGVSMPSGQFEIEVFSAVRSAMQETDKTVAVLDFGASATRVYVVDGGVVQRMFSVRTGGQALTKLLAEAKAVSFSEAEILKRQHGLNPAEETRAVLEKPVRRIASEVQHILKRYEDNHSIVIEGVICTGGGAEMIGLTTLLSDALSRPVRAADPFAKVAYPAFMEDVLTAAGPDFATAIGVALRPLLESE